MFWNLGLSVDLFTVCKQMQRLMTSFEYGSEFWYCQESILEKGYERKGKDSRIKTKWLPKEKAWVLYE